MNRTCKQTVRALLILSCSLILCPLLNKFQHNCMKLIYGQQLIVQPLSSLVEGDEGSELPNGPPRLSICHQRAMHKGKKLDCIEHNHVFCFKLQCASIVVLLCTAIWWKLKDAVVHWIVSFKKHTSLPHLIF